MLQDSKSIQNIKSNLAQLSRFLDQNLAKNFSGFKYKLVAKKLRAFLSCQRQVHVIFGPLYGDIELNLTAKVEIVKRSSMVTFV